MKAIPNALDKAKELIKDNPGLFNPDVNKVLIAAIIARAMLEFSIECDKANLPDQEPNSQVHPLFKDIIIQFKF